MLFVIAGSSELLLFLIGRFRRELWGKSDVSWFQACCFKKPSCGYISRIATGSMKALDFVGTQIHMRACVIELHRQFEYIIVSAELSSAT